MFGKILCKIFGHKVDDIDLMICKLKLCAVNAHELSYELKCKRCGVNLLIEKGLKYGGTAKKVNKSNNGIR